MSWLSRLTRTEGKTPDWLKKAGDKVGGFVINAIPGGSTVDGIFDLTNTRGGGPSPEDLFEATYGNLRTSAATGVQAARAAGAAQNAAQDFATGAGLLMRNPVTLPVLLVFALILLRRK